MNNTADDETANRFLIEQLLPVHAPVLLTRTSNASGYALRLYVWNGKLSYHHDILCRSFT